MVGKWYQKSLQAFTLRLLKGAEHGDQMFIDGMNAAELTFPGPESRASRVFLVKEEISSVHAQHAPKRQCHSLSFLETPPLPHPPRTHAQAIDDADGGKTHQRRPTIIPRSRSLALDLTTASAGALGKVPSTNALVMATALMCACTRHRTMQAAGVPLC